MGAAALHTAAGNGRAAPTSAIPGPEPSDPRRRGYSPEGASAEPQACAVWPCGTRGPDIERDAARSRDNDADVVLGEAPSVHGGPIGAADKCCLGLAVAQRVPGVDAWQEPEVSPVRA